MIMVAATSTAPLTIELARRVNQIDYDALPAVLIAGIKRSLLDTLAVSWAAWEHEDVQRLVPAAAALASGTESTLWGTEIKVPATYAALANGILAAALDYDSLQDVALVHGDICVWPAAFALAEREKKSGRELVTAVALGAEIAYRLGNAALTNSGWFYTSINGCFGAAAACGKLLELDDRRLANALAIVMSRAAGTQQPALEQAGTKRVQSAFAAQVGLEAALLAYHGLDGPLGAIEGRFGLFEMYEGGNPEAVLAGFGVNYLAADVSYKKFPCCACSHAAMEAALRLKQEHAFDVSDVSEIEVKITPFMNRLVGGSFDPEGNPTVTGQFSIRYGLAAALMRDGFTVADILPDRVTDAEVGSLARQVVVSEFDDEDGRLTPATVTLKMKSGKTLSKRLDEIPGAPQSPLSSDEFNAKIMDCVSRGDHALTSQQTERLIRATEGLADFDDVSRIFPWIHHGDPAPRAAAG